VAPKRITTDVFIDRAKGIYDDRYDYSKTEYTNTNTKLTITCRDHGDFEMLPGNHTHKTRPQGCPKCAGKGLTTEDWIERFQSKYGTRFDYSKFEYRGVNEKITIICPVHGERITKIHGHLKSPTGCERCSSEQTGRNQRRSQDSVIQSFVEKHGDKFDYSYVEYKGADVKIKIICPEHGEFWQLPHHHLGKYGCNECAYVLDGINRRLSKEEVLAKAFEIHGDKYDYSKFEYGTIEDDMVIICPTHGEFTQRVNNHVNQGNGCPECSIIESGLKRRVSQEEWLERFGIIHGDQYDYSLFETHGADVKSRIICKEHGLFLQAPITHSNGVGCPDCGRDKAALQRRLSQDDVLDRFREVHGETYDYSLVEYTVSQENVTIICKKHGPFEQLTHVHANGAGCPKCSRISAGLKRRLTINDVLERFREAHGERFDYSEFVFRSDRAKATIICREHGPFEQSPADHWTSVHGCARCAGRNQTTEGMIEQFRATHGDRYDYSDFAYRGNKVHSTIICSDHGPFEQVPHAHRSGHGCPQCGILKIADKRRLSNEEILQKFREVHGDRYDYSRVEYSGNSIKVTIVCHEHGAFEQSPGNHAHKSRPQGCPKCGRILLSEKGKLNPEQVLERFEKVHGNTYDYSRVEYTGTQNNVTIVCEKHGPFEQAPNNHLAGQGCPDCGRISLSEKSTHTQEQVIGKFREIHGDTYDYSRVEYSGNSIKVTIVCHEHGPFEQPPSSHKSGQGCPSCSTLGFRNEQPGYYYCLSIRGHGGHWWYKGGISGDPQRRAGQIQSSLLAQGLLLDVEVVDSIRFERGVDARNLESKLLGVEDIRTFTIERFDGSRELFSYNPIEFSRARGWI